MREAGCSKRPVQQGRRPFDARSVLRYVSTTKSRERSGRPFVIQLAVSSRGSTALLGNCPPPGGRALSERNLTGRTGHKVCQINQPGHMRV